MQDSRDLDPVYAGDRAPGSTPPESGEQGGNVVGRPRDAKDHAIGFHEQAETVAHEREPLSGEEALVEGGSFDGLGLPVADDAQRSET